MNTLLNRPSTVDSNALGLIPQKPVHESLDLPPTEEKVVKADGQVNSVKSPGLDGIPGEICKAAGHVTLNAFTELLNILSFTYVKQLFKYTDKWFFSLVF